MHAAGDPENSQGLLSHTTTGRNEKQAASFLEHGFSGGEQKEERPEGSLK